MRVFIPLFLFLSFCSAAFSQGRVRGKVMEDKAYIPVAGAKVENLTNRATIATDAAGAFSIVAKTGDVLRFSSLGYKPDTVYLKDMEAIAVYLSPDANMLNEVQVKEMEFAKGAFAAEPALGPLGSKTVRYQADKNGNPIGGVKFSPSSLFGKGKSDEAKIKQYEQQVAIAQVFNEKTLAPYLPITGQELTNFVILYIPTAEAFYNEDFKLTDYVNESYKKFMLIPAGKRRSKDLVSLK